MFTHTTHRRFAALLALAIFMAGTGAQARPRYRDNHTELTDRTTKHNEKAIEFAQHFKQVAEEQSRDRNGLRDLVLTFVQTLDYYPEAEDEYIPEPVRGVMDWWQYADETLLRGGGDCEDVAILAYVMLTSLGYEAVFANFDAEMLGGKEGHLSLAVVVGEDEPYNYDVEGRHFAYVECTSLAPVGFVPEDYRVAVQLIEL
jgi:hypothetical protein